MNVQAYYKRNVSYNFNKKKQQDILDKLSKEQLQNLYQRKLTAKKERLFCKVNTERNTDLMISLIEEKLTSYANMKTYYQVSKFKTGTRSCTGKIQATEKPQNCEKYDWYENEIDAREQNKFAKI